MYFIYNKIYTQYVYILCIYYALYICIYYIYICIYILQGLFKAPF